MHLRVFIKRQVKVHFLTIARLLIVVVCPLAALFVLILAGILLGKHSFDPRFECVSSFIEVMIVVDASCSFKKIGEWLTRKREEHQVETLKAANDLYGAVEELSPVPEQITRLTLINLCAQLDVYVKYVGLSFSVLLACWLVVGVSGGAKPYAVLAAFPLLSYLFSTVVANRLVEIAYVSIVNAGRSHVPPPPVDDNSIVSLAMGCTGPVLDEKGVDT